MAHAVSPAGSVARSVSHPSDDPGSTGGPWQVWCGALAVTSAMIGLEWDIAWHSSIGRDTFWTPAHMMVYACGMLTALACGHLVLVTTFGKPSGMRAKMQANAVHIFGFRAPLGGFVATWGGLAMLVSAPFDDWWHSAYGLDVQVLSPPHVLLFFGLAMIAFGFLLLCAGAMNRAATLAGRDAGASGDGKSYRQLQAVFLYLGGLNLMMYMIILEQRIELWLLHNAIPYVSLALLVPFLLALLSQVSRHRWAATTAATVYSIIRIGAIQILPLFPATPKLGPVFTPVTHLVPAEFPILLIVPAIALDLLWRHIGQKKLWQLAVLSGFVFTAALVAAEWPFADFLISKYARNGFFGTIYVGYATHAADRIPHLARVQSGWPLWRGLLVAAICASVLSWIGLAMGRWMRSVQR